MKLREIIVLLARKEILTVRAHTAGAPAKTQELRISRASDKVKLRNKRLTHREKVCQRKGHQEKAVRSYPHRIDYGGNLLCGGDSVLL
jgi:hypothetical protein